jgi:predicted metal-dependent peptidase
MNTREQFEYTLSACKSKLILDHPFFATLALNLRMSINDTMPWPAATNGVDVTFNPELMKRYTPGETMFILAHEVMHVALSHITRYGARDRKKFNVACDIAINKILKDDRVGTMPDDACYSDEYYERGGGTAEGIYNILPDSSDCMPDMQPDPNQDPSELKQLQQDIQVKLAQAKATAKMAGKLSSAVERLVDTLLESRVDWRAVIHKFLVRSKNDERNYARFNRRFLSQRMYLPAVSTGDKIGPVVFAVDCSGSIDDRTISQFATEILTVKENFNPETIHIIYFDSRVSHYDVYGEDETPVVKPHGGGGTDFAPVFDEIRERNIEPVAVIFLTDLCCDSFGTPPECDVLWVSTYANKAPFGEVVMMKEV